MPEVPVQIDLPEPTPASWSVDRQPDEDELYQLEPVDLRVPVDVQGPVQAQPMGAVDQTFRLVTVDDVTGGKLFNADPRRSTVTLIPVDQPIWLAGSVAEVQGTLCAKIPIGAVLQIPATQRLFARSATPATAANITVIMSQWTR